VIHFLAAMCLGGMLIPSAARAADAPGQPGAKAHQPAGSAAPRAWPAGSGGVAGRVAAADGQRLPEIVIFLESADPGFSFASAPEPIVVSQQKASFRPSLIVVPVGSKVDFRNDEKGPVEHNVFSKSEAKKFDLGLYKPEDPIDPVTFDTPGAVRLRCSIHRYMDGVVYVTPTPYFAVVEKDGRFSIAGVKPGNYRIKTWQRSRRFREIDMPIVITGGKTLAVNLTMAR
jgi:plastocyanin